VCKVKCPYDQSCPQTYKKDPNNENRCIDPQGNTHDFSGYTSADKTKWSCNQHVPWFGYNDITNGWFVDGKCTNDIAEIVTKADCGVYGYIVDVRSDPQKPKCVIASNHDSSGQGVSKYNNTYHDALAKAPGSSELLATQVLHNIGFITENSFSPDLKDCEIDDDGRSTCAKYYQSGKLTFAQNTFFPKNTKQGWCVNNVNNADGDRLGGQFKAKIYQTPDYHTANGRTLSS
jgi:hypothetical protein